MNINSNGKSRIITLGITGILAGVTFLIVLWQVSHLDKSFKPYIPYVKLVNLAAACDDYKKQYGGWPTNINQLGMLRPDLNEAKTDAYGHDVVLVPYSEALGYGEIVSYGRDGKLGGSNKFDQDIALRFPVETQTNAQWNKQVGKRFKDPMKL